MCFFFSIFFWFAYLFPFLTISVKHQVHFDKPVSRIVKTNGVFSPPFKKLMQNKKKKRDKKEVYVVYPERKERNLDLGYLVVRYNLRSRLFRKNARARAGMQSVSKLCFVFLSTWVIHVATMFFGHLREAPRLGGGGFRTCPEDGCDC